MSMNKKLQQINEKETVKEMKKRLEYLQSYCANIRLQSVLYGDETQVLQVEDDICDYLHYSKSVVQIHHSASSQNTDPILQAFIKQQRHHSMIAKRDAQAYIVLQGIAQLPPAQRELLFDVYVRCYTKQKIMLKAGGIVESTFHRRLHKAILNLANILHVEQ